MNPWKPIFSPSLCRICRNGCDKGFGRAIRTETDTCVVSILDNRAVQGGKYHEDVLNALPTCQMAEELREVQAFIRSRKGVEYYL